MKGLEQLLEHWCFFPLPWLLKRNVTGFFWILTDLIGDTNIFLLCSFSVWKYTKNFVSSSLFFLKPNFGNRASYSFQKYNLACVLVHQSLYWTELRKNIFFTRERRKLLNWASGNCIKWALRLWLYYLKVETIRING